MANLISPLQTGEGRIFINPEEYGGTTSFEFHNCMKIDGLDKTIGEAEPVYCPDPSRYDEFIEVAVIKGAESRWSSSLSGKLYGDGMSPLELLSVQRTPVTLQIHYGRCTRPDDFNAFDSAIVLEDVRISSYALSALTAANPGERGMIEETSNISAGNMYRIFNPQVVSAKTGMNLTLVGLTNIDTKVCGLSTSIRGNGAKVWAFISIDDAYVFHYTLDGGATWIDSATTKAPGEWETIVINDGSYFYLANDEIVYRISISSVINGEVPSVETVATLGDTDLIITDISATDSTIWVLAADGTTTQIYTIDKGTGTVALVEEIALTTSYKIKAFDDTTVVFTHGSGLYSYMNSNGAFVVASAVGASPLIDLHMFDESNWVAASASGVYVTGDAGLTWQNRLTMTGGAKMTWYDNLTGYLLLTSAVYRTIDSGRTWKLVASFSSDSVVAINVSEANPNIFMLQTKTGLATTTLKSQVGN